ncbi:3-keto-disaccharide hydrolase [Planctomicrobium sp. SH664]|uniref:3-keto-disaccharide hydrolase n=1 Tax=Planctomicrobium sp. SH664 TaxID=3448125 RepID=UPI003F5B14CF
MPNRRDGPFAPAATLPLKVVIVNLFVRCAAIALICLCSSQTWAEQPPHARIDGQGPGWETWTLANFERVNGDDNTWSMQGESIRTTGTPIGVTRSREQLTNFELVVEWRHLEAGGNSGIFVWASEEALKDLPPGKLPPGGIEVQVLDPGFAEKYEKETGKRGTFFTCHGDVFAVGTSKMTPFPPLSPNKSRSFPRKELTRSTPEWNHYYVRAINGEIRLWVNGEEVSGGSDCKPSTGYLCLEAEGAPAEFRNLRIRKLP